MRIPFRFLRKTSESPHGSFPLDSLISKRQRMEYMSNTKLRFESSRRAAILGYLSASSVYFEGQSMEAQE